MCGGGGGSERSGRPGWGASSASATGAAESPATRVTSGRKGASRVRRPRTIPRTHATPMCRTGCTRSFRYRGRGDTPLPRWNRSRGIAIAFRSTSRVGVRAVLRTNRDSLPRSRRVLPHDIPDAHPSRLSAIRDQDSLPHFAILPGNVDLKPTPRSQSGHAPIRPG